MSTNEYNENIDPKKEAAEAAAAADALAALGGSSIDSTSEKKKRKKRTTEPELEIVEENKKGNKYTSEKEKTEKLNTATAAATATKESATATKETASASATATKKNDRPSTRRTLVQIMNGEILTKDTVLNNLPFTCFIGFLFIVMIAWGYYAETVTKKEIQLEKELGELNSEFFTLTADYNMQRGRRQIANRLEHTGVKESQTSPKKIRVRKYVFN